MPGTMADGAQTGGASGQQPEQRSALGFPLRPGGDGGAVAGGRHHWYELAQEIHGAFADIDRSVTAMQWSGDGRRAFDAAWSQFSGHATEAAQHSQEMGDHLLKLGHEIEDAQHQWDMAMTAMAASTAIGIGLTFVTFGISDALAEGAAAAAVTTMEAVCTALDISLEAAMQVMITAIRIGVELAVKFTWQFGINVITQETANAVEHKGLDNVNLLQAAEFAAAATLIPELGGKVTIGGRQVMAGAKGALASGALTDATFQGMEAVTEGKPFNPGEVVASGLLAVGGQAFAGAVGGRLNRPGGSPLQSGGVAKASDVARWAEGQGWTRSRTPTGPVKYVDENGIPRVTIKQGSPRTPGSEQPHVELRDATGQRVDPWGNPVVRRSPANHTPIDWDLT